MSKKLLCLDLGDAWTGIAISDALKMFARPYKTVATKNLTTSLTEIFQTEPIQAVVVGNPQTMKGTESDQTKKVLVHKEELEQTFADVQWILWDERLSSKRAASLSTKKKKHQTKEEKLHEHAVAAAFVLDSYLTFSQQ